jgi:glutathione S-transferase
MSKPILYTFRRCPYAIRARLALKVSGVELEMHEVSLRAKPQALLDCSPKGTVPVLQLADGTVIEQSLDIMRWALARHDPQAWLGPHGLAQQDSALIARNDGQFKQDLDRYKYAERFPQQPATHYRQQAETFLAELERRLAAAPWLGGQRPGLADFAIFPFIRQFAGVEPDWFQQSPYRHLLRWLDRLLASPLFVAVMQK